MTIDKAKEKVDKFEFKGKAYNSFSAKLMNSLSQDSGNVVYSPLSVFTAVCMAAAGASGETRQEILNVMDRSFTTEDLISIMEYLRESDDAVISANAICVRHDMANTIKNDYLKVIREAFNAEYFMSQDIVDDVNRWVKEKTDNMIPEILDDSAADTLCSLVNATTFTNEWEDPYDDYQVSKRNFYNMSGSVSKVNMLFGNVGQYIGNRYVRGFIKSYKNSRYGFMALLPKRKGEEALRKAIANMDFSEVCENYTWYEVHTYMPEFEYRYVRELTSIMTDMGMKKMFRPDADFSGMSTFDLFVDQVIHKSYIKVDRNGTKAAAATIMDWVGACPPEEYKTVTLNRPFIYAIMDVEKNVPIFSGIVREL